MNDRLCLRAQLENPSGSCGNLSESLVISYGMTLLFSSVLTCISDFVLFHFRGFGEGKLKLSGKSIHILESCDPWCREKSQLSHSLQQQRHLQDPVVKSLGLNNPAIVIKSPRRENIKYVVMKTEEKDIVKTFKWKLEEVRERGKHAERLIVLYCRTKAQCNHLYATFEHELKPTNDQERYFAKFHMQTDTDVKNYIMDNFKELESHLRLFFATVAFGMGVDAKNLYNIVHYGPPHDIEEFVQERGRAGRDGKASLSVLVSYPGAGSITPPNQAMKDYINSETCTQTQLGHVGQLAC